MAEKSVQPLDVVLIGGGIMSATLGALIHRLEPTWRIKIFERLSLVAEESSNPWNNAGTGHSALCELNYTPELPDGRVDISKAVTVNEQFQVSRQFWAHLVETGELAEPTSFINPTPHISFVWGSDNVEYMRRRYEAMKDHPLFKGLRYSDSAATIRKWAPALIPGRRKDQPIAATYSAAGSDVDFGSLTRQLLDGLVRDGVVFEPNHVVKSLRRRSDGTWDLLIKNEIGQSRERIAAKFVFVGAGGGALHLLQNSGIPEIRGYGGFPVSGEFLRTDDPEVVVKHSAKVYGKASVGAPPMSVPHLDTRIVDGRASLMFGPYAGFSPKFLKNGSVLDLFRSIRVHNIRPLLSVAFANFDLVKYLVGQLMASKKTKFAALQEFMAAARPEDWHKIIAGQRVQVIKPTKDGRSGTLQFGTEVVASADGSIAGLLGASPGASTAVPIMLTLLERCFPNDWSRWQQKVQEMIPTYGQKLSDDPKLADETLTRTARVLGLHH